MQRLLFPASLAVVLAGCTSVQVSPLATVDANLCIERNPKVIVEDFVPVLQEGFARHGISTQVFEGALPGSCRYQLTYDARRSWDFAPYLSTAELTVRGPDRQVVGRAQYHLRAKGGLSLAKWQGTRSKMDPVIDRLLASTQVLASPAATPAASAAIPSSRGPSREQQLDALQQEHLDYQEYNRRYQQILQQTSP